MRGILATAFLCVFSTHAFAQPPTFDAYPVKDTIQTTTAPVDVDLQTHPKANEYRVRLRNALRGGPNFAGQYTLVSWACGLDCVTAAIIDTTTGAVYFPKELAFLGTALLQYDVDSAAAGLLQQDALTYKRDSKLLIVSGYPSPDGETRKDGGVFYYLWEDNQLRLIAQALATTPPDTTLP